MFNQLDEFEAFELLETTYIKQFQRIKQRLTSHLQLIKLKLMLKYTELDLSKIILSFEDCFIDENEYGMIFARCSDLDNQIIEFNCYPIAKMLNQKFSVNNILTFYKSHNVLIHQVAHIVDYMLNGDKPLQNQHDNEFKKIFTSINQFMLKENKQMKFNKFKLLFEDLMSNVNNVMQDSMVTYELFDNIINKNIAEALNLSEEELTQEYGKFTAQIADKDLILSTVYHGFHTPENEKEAEELANKIVVLNLAETKLSEEDYLFLQHESDLAENILKDLQANGYNELIEVYIV